MATKSKFTTVRNYSDEQILNQAMKAEGFKGFPKKRFIISIRSLKDVTDQNDDKFYLFNGGKLDPKFNLPTFEMVFPGTTNPGKVGLYSFDDYNSKGVAVMASNIWMYDVWTQRKHRGKIDAWCQNKKTWFYRDGNKNGKSEEIGERYFDSIGLNFHPQTYINGSEMEKQFIGAWSLGCQCPSRRSDFDKVMRLTKDQSSLSYLILKEF